MESGVSFPSYASEAVWTVASGGFSSDFPIANLSDLKAIRRVAKAGGGAQEIDFVLPAGRELEFIALVHHNGSATDTFRVRLFSDDDPDPVGNAGAIVYDSGAIAMFPAGDNDAGWSLCAPHRFDAVTAQSGRISLSTRSSGSWTIGGVEISGWWAWNDVEVDRGLGIVPRSVVTQQAAGVDHMTRVWAPRSWDGSRGIIDQAEVDTTLLDFQRATGFEEPFIFAWDVEDSSTWVRECFLATNERLGLGQVLFDGVGAFDFAFLEHLG